MDYISDIIGEDFKSWQHGESVFLSAGTGTGKTYFLAHVWAEWLKKEGSERILYLSNRSALHEQTRNDLAGLDQSFEDREAYALRTYQRLSKILEDGNQSEIDWLNSFENIFVDECHYFFVDSIFNDKTNLALKWLLSRQKDCCIVWATGTGESVFSPSSWLRSACKPSHEYLAVQTYNHVDQVAFFRGDSSVLAYRMHEYIKKEGRSVLLISNDSPKICAVEEKLTEHHHDVAVIVSPSNKNSNLKKYQKKSDEYRELLTDIDLQEQGENFPFTVLIATTTIDTGINVKDRRLGAIFTDLIEPEPIVQALGRKRPIDPADSVSFFVNLPSEERLEKALLAHDDAFQQLKEFDSDPAAFAEKYFSFPAVCQWDKQPVKDYLLPSPDSPFHEINQAKYQRLRQLRAIYREIEKDGFKNFLLSSYLKPLKGRDVVLVDPDPVDLNTFINEQKDSLIRKKIASEIDELCFDAEGNPIPICKTHAAWLNKGEAKGYLDPDRVKDIYFRNRVSAMTACKNLLRKKLLALSNLSGLSTYTLKPKYDSDLRISILYFDKI